jgi:hypothetical protein
MKAIAITIHVILALIVSQLPSRADAGVSQQEQQTPRTSTTMIRKGQRPSIQEIAELELKCSQSQPKISAEAGGAEATSGVLVLAVIGALVVLGAVVYAVNKNNQKEE